MKIGFTSLHLQSGLTAETKYKVVQLYQGGGSDTVMTEEHREYKQFVQTKQSSVPDAEQVIVVFMDMVTCIVVFMAGFFVIANMATIRRTYHM